MAKYKVNVSRGTSSGGTSSGGSLWRASSSEDIKTLTPTNGANGVSFSNADSSATIVYTGEGFVTTAPLYVPDELHASSISGINSEGLTITGDATATNLTVSNRLGVTGNSGFYGNVSITGVCSGNSVRSASYLVSDTTEAATVTASQDVEGAAFVFNQGAGYAGIYRGNGDSDAQTLGTGGAANIIIKSWYGLGFVSQATGGLTVGFNLRNGDTHIAGRFLADGYITAAGEVTAYSDARVKADVATLASRGGVRPVTFRRTDEGQDHDRRHIGFIAQEVERLYPELVSEGENGIKSLNYAAYTAVLQAQVDELRGEAAMLRQEIDELKKKI